MTATISPNDWYITDLGPEETIPYELLLQADPSKARIDEYLKSSVCRVLSKTGGSNFVGIYVLQIKPSSLIDELASEAEILNISVTNKHQGSGLGRLLINDAVAMARRHNVRNLQVGTGNSSVSQLAFYQKCGFRIVGIEFDYFTINYAEKIVENGIWCRDLIKMTMSL